MVLIKGHERKDGQGIDKLEAVTTSKLDKEKKVALDVQPIDVGTITVAESVTNELLQQIIRQLEIMNFHLQLITENQLDE